MTTDKNLDGLSGFHFWVSYSQIISICDNWQEFGWTEWISFLSKIPLSPSKFLSVVTDDNDLPVTASESDGDSAFVTQKWNPLSPSKFLSVVTDANDLPVTDSGSDGDSAVEE